MNSTIMTLRARGSLARVRHLTFALIVALAASAVAPAQDGKAKSDEMAVKNLQWRAIGPANMGGRIDDLAVVENNPSIIYAGAATGGVWKTTNNGTTWEPLFDEQGSTSIGDICIAPSDPNIVWVGTGEPNNRQSSSWGDGVYRSLDGGKSWQNMGLKDTKHIGRVVIDPRDPNTVYVAAVGHLWGPNKERGLYKTTDGGKTWAQSLFINEDTGVIDVALDLQSPMTLYAAAYQRRRTAFGFNGGGPGSGLYKTVDGGATWVKLTKDLPEGATGRIGLDIYRGNPNIVYAIIENAKGGVFRSEDRGATWRKMSDVNSRPVYYSQIRIDPNNDQRIWQLAAPMFVSEDGGKTWQTDTVTRIHGDYHALWIDPANSNHMVTGSDGGIHISYDRGRSWDYINTIPLGQFYEISLDNRKPYWVYGGLQDNGSWAGPSGTLYQEGITNDDWFRTGGGDGFYSVVDPTDPDVIYVESQNGSMARLEMKTGERRSIKPQAMKGEPEYRFDWNTPIVISPHNNRTIYVAGNRVFRSTDRGDTWARSDDLTNNQDRDKMPIMGALPNKDMLSRHDGQETFGQVVTLSESPIKEGLLYAGTDDGNLQISRDAGKTWKNITGRVPGVPKGTYVSRVVASRHAEGTAYLTFDGHRSDDYNTYVFMTTDFGESWKTLKGNLPAGVTARVIREHPRKQGLLFLGTEFGAFVSFDRGARWTRLKGNLPLVRVDDIQIHPRDNDLVLGTHGRSVWVLDDITPFEMMSDAVTASDVTIFDVEPATHFRLYGRKGNTGHKYFSAANPPYGAVINYYLKDKPKDDVKVTITDKGGKVVRELRAGKEEGLNRVVWDLRMTPPVQPQENAQGAGQGGGFFFGGPRGPRVAPGEYGVQVSAAGKQATKTVRVEEDPRIQINEADRARLSEAQMKVYALQKSADAARRSLANLKAQMTALQETMRKTPGASAAVTSSVKSVSDQVNDLQRKLVGESGPLGGAGPPLPDEPRPLLGRVGQAAGGLDSYTAAPTADDERRIEDLSDELKAFIGQLNKLIDEAVPNLNKQMRDSGMTFVNAGQRVSIPQ
ncbi:MAG: WD40/YVTN/BNR-like repeat-containing protein [Blastocatellia bacterium]